MKLNLKQRAIMAVVVPLCVFFIAISIATDIGWRDNPYDWSRTGGVWLLSTVLVGIFELFLWRDRK